MLIANFCKQTFPNMRKSELNFAPDIILAMINSQSVVISGLALYIFKLHPHTQIQSIERRIRRFFNNTLYTPYSFYDKFINFIIDNYKLNHDDNRVHICFDHMFVKDYFTVLMFTLRIGKQGIPIYFRCFNGKGKPGFNVSFKAKTIKGGILYCHNLFKKKNVNLIFLADRWFGNHFDFLEYIDSLGDTYVVRTMSNIRTLCFDKKEQNKVWKTIKNLNGFVYHSKIYNNISITNNLTKVNLIISKKTGHNEPWNIITNGDPRRAIKDYAYRFGGIECLFKNQKSNGFYLEDTRLKHVQAFANLYSWLCFTCTWLISIGLNYTRNTGCYKNIKFAKTRFVNGKRLRLTSLFHLGLNLFTVAYNSSIYIKIPLNFILYDC